MADLDVITAFATARRSEVPLDFLPEPAPPDMDRAFRLQSAVTRDLGWRQAGWKIGCTSLRAQRALNASGPFPGTMFEQRVFRSGDRVPAIASNKRVVEPEVAFVMGRGLPRRERDYAVAEVLAAVDAVRAAIEIVNPRTPNGFADPVPWFVVDGGLNDSIVLGDAMKPLTVDAYPVLRAAVSWNDCTMDGGLGANALGGGHLALTWLANHLIANGTQLMEGDIVSTGVITEFFSARPGDTVVANFEQLGSVSVSF